ncbi:MAG: serine/threonine-protein kinase [Gemmatimonadota bacterium]|nr:serine/threonine-protein kinase [Gemmatimonadota bacterium]
MSPEDGPAPERGPADLEIGRALALRDSAGATFERERSDLLFRRVRLVLGIGVVVNVLLWGFTQFQPLAEPVAWGPEFWRWKRAGDLAYPLSVLAGLLFVQFARPGTRGLEITAFLVAAVNLLLGMAMTATARPDMLLGFWIALILFVMAALLPWDVRWQIGLVVLAVAGSAGALYGAEALFPEVRAFWNGELAILPARTFAEQVGLTVAGTVVLGATSVVVARTLYDLRRTAFKASRLGNYLIHRELGEGGMGQVFVAEHALMCRPSAVKVLRAKPGSDPSALARFEREVRLASSLSHPNTITIFDFGRAGDDTFYYAMEYLEGLDLERFVERFGPVPANRAIYILRQVASSLEEAHQRGIIHRDLKPSNIFLTMRGGLFDFVKVLDFGLAKQIEGTDRGVGLTKTGVIFGTPRYLAPETVYGDDEVDARSDIYNLGGVAFWMLTGRPPFTADTAVALMVDHVKSKPPVPSEVSELEIPPELDELVLRCLEKDPLDRFASAREFRRALDAIPVEEPWDGDKAENWWSLHMSADELLQDCFCPPIEELTREGMSAGDLQFEAASG